MTRSRIRANGEGSIFPYRTGFAAYVWVTKPDGKRGRKYIYGKTREEVHERWIRLHQEARRGPVATRTPKLEDYLRYWLAEIIEPNRAPATFAGYETYIRLYIQPGLGNKRLDKLQARDVQTWINAIPKLCQCCIQGKDAKRKNPALLTSENRPQFPIRNIQRCCALGKCCNDHPSSRTIRNIRDCLRAAITCAITDGLISHNVAAHIKLPSSHIAKKRKKGNAWSASEARQFLDSARKDNDPLYAAYVFVLVLGMRKGEVLGTSWNDISFDTSTLNIEFQLQRVRGKLYHREVKTPTSEAPLPLPDICLTALQLRQVKECENRTQAGQAWHDTGLVFTTKYGTPIEPRNFNRAWDARCLQAGVPKITVHDARRTCGSLLAALDVHPRVAMQILRHTDFKITMEVYTHVSDQQTREALKRLGNSLDRDAA